MGANYLFYVKSIATFALTFFGYIISVLASVTSSLAYAPCSELRRPQKSVLFVIFLTCSHFHLYSQPQKLTVKALKVTIVFGQNRGVVGCSIVASFLKDVHVNKQTIINRLIMNSRATDVNRFSEILQIR